jgi:anti-sigma28 factor (negative regulator of flagellin synthesis)
MRVTSLSSAQRPAGEVAGVARRAESASAKPAEPAAEPTLSDEARLIALAQRSLTAAAAARTRQVQQLRTSVQAGTYTPDAARVCASLCATPTSGGT